MKNLIGWIILFFYAISSEVVAQKGDSLLTLARGYVKTNQYQDAFKHYLLALPAYQKTKDNLTQSNIYKELGLLCSVWQIDEKATEYFLKSYQIGKSTILNTFDNQRFWFENLATSHHKIQQNDSALYYYQRLLELTQQQNPDSPALPATLYQIANIHLEQGNYDKALPSNNTILAYYKRLGDKKNEAIALNNIGFNYKFLKNYTQSIQYFEQSLALQKVLGMQETPEFGVTLLNLGVLNQNVKEYEKAKNYLLAYQKAIEKKGSPAQIAELYNLLGTVYFLENDYENALEYNQKAVQLAEKHTVLPTLESSYLVLSQVYQALKEDKTALAYYQKYKATNDKILQEELEKDRELLRRKSLSTDLENDLKMRAIEKEILELDVRNIRLEADKKQQDYEILLKNSELQTANLKQKETENARREAENAREVQALLVAKQKAETEKRRQENELLTQKNELQSLALKQKELERAEKQRALELKEEQVTAQKAQIKAEQAQNEAQKAQVRSYYYVSILLLILMLLAGVAFWQKQRDSKKITSQNIDLQRAIKEVQSAQTIIEEQNADLEQRQEELETTLELVEVQKQEIEIKNADLENTLILVEAQKKEIEKTHEDMTASINYALRIQQAMLPNVSYLKTFFPEIFVIFKPRDIVSGDFYWFAHQGEYDFLVLADCTGHGVPGAFMTMMGSGALSHIVCEDEIYEPSAILKELDERILERVQVQAGDKKVEDGMDMTLLRIKGNELIFCSARRPMIYFQEGEMKELKGSRAPIGSTGYGVKHFEEVKITIQKGDMFYMFSDGYVDQFNPEGQKFRIGQLREILKETYPKDTETQQTILDNAFENWRGKERRVDDVTLIGLRIT